MIRAVHTIFTQVEDMKRATAFYSGVLGFELGYSSEHWTSMSLGGLKLGLHKKYEDYSGSQIQGWVLGVETDDVRALREVLIQAGVHADPFYHETPTGVVLDFRDTEGNWLQAIQLNAKLSDFR